MQYDLFLRLSRRRAMKVNSAVAKLDKKTVNVQDQLAKKKKNTKKWKIAF